MDQHNFKKHNPSCNQGIFVNEKKQNYKSSKLKILYALHQAHSFRERREESKLLLLNTF